MTLITRVHTESGRRKWSCGVGRKEHRKDDCKDDTFKYLIFNIFMPGVSNSNFKEIYLKGKSIVYFDQWSISSHTSAPQSNRHVSA